jgi:hypothetical protein
LSWQGKEAIALKTGADQGAGLLGALRTREYSDNERGNSERPALHQVAVAVLILQLNKVLVNGRLQKWPPLPKGHFSRSWR